MIPLNDRSGRNCVELWLRSARGYDLDLYRHSIFVGQLTTAFSAYLGFSPADQQLLRQAALLHDIGKMQIRRDLLRKPEALTLAETLEMRSHPELGYLLLRAEGGYDTEVLSVIRHHHERLVGSGYPNGLLAADISDSVRIVTLCDIFAAMTKARPYGKPLQCQDALLLMATKSAWIDLGLLRPFEAMIMSSLPGSVR
jgi:putative nucleotidyltransferase with HDIG domain